MTYNLQPSYPNVSVLTTNDKAIAVMYGRVPGTGEIVPILVDGTGALTTAGGGGGSGAAGSTGNVQFNVSGSFGGSANLFWDNTHGWLGIGTSSPAYPLDVVGDINTSTMLRLGGAFGQTVAHHTNNVIISGVLHSGGTGTPGSITVGDVTSSSGPSPTLIKAASGVAAPGFTGSLGMTAGNVSGDVGGGNVNIL